jgi:ferredoxin
MRVDVDRDLCEGSATCVARLPSVFKLDHNDRAVVNPDAAEECTTIELEEVIEACPFEAILSVD